jgi:hypothetical protein
MQTEEVGEPFTALEILIECPFADQECCTFHLHGTCVTSLQMIVRQNVLGFMNSIHLPKSL